MLLLSNLNKLFSIRCRSLRSYPNADPLNLPLSSLFARSISTSINPPLPRDLAPNSKLFVAGLSWSMDERSLVDAFSSFGDVVQVRIMFDKNSGRSRGFGFVEFSTENEAVSAKDAMDGKVLLGRRLRINFAVDKVRGLPVIVPRVSSAG